MDKNWLIRTKSNHILGPVSKDKIKELYNNGSIKPDDEICSGNGFWFYLREEELVKRFLLGDEVQRFNPVSEAKDILTAHPLASKDLDDSDDITLIGKINLKANEESKHQSSDTKNSTEYSEKSLQTEPKKKYELESLSNESDLAPPLPESKSEEPVVIKIKYKQQNYLKWLGIIAFILLVCLIYYRKTILSLRTPHIFLNEAQAQTESLQKKKLLESSVVLDGITFYPLVDLGGFRVASTFDIDALNCGELKNHVKQLGVILYPPELINEKFLIKLRRCIVKMPEVHPLKRWLNFIARPQTATKEEQVAIDLLTEVLNSRYNLITDQTLKVKIVNQLTDIPENALGEILLRSYLYLIIGNVTKSDNILKDFINHKPFENWKRFAPKPSIYQKLANDHVEQILSKLSNHPSDRKMYNLFALYLTHFYHSSFLTNIVNENRAEISKQELDLKHTSKLAPDFVNYLKLSSENKNEQLAKLAVTDESSIRSHLHWTWPFIDVIPQITGPTLIELQKIETENRLYFIYLMDNDRVVDSYTKKTQRSLILGRRKYLHDLLGSRPDFNLALYKIIEFGDIDDELVNQALRSLTHE
jgi:hypothetical protein